MRSIGRKLVRVLYGGAVRAVLGPALYLEWKHPRFRVRNERPLEFAYALRWLAELYPETVLDVGTGITAWPQILANCGFRVTAADKVSGYWKDGLVNRHFHVIHDDITDTKLDGRFDVVTCLSVLEHIPDHDAAMANMFGLLASGGHLIVTCPYNERSYVPNVYELEGSRARQRPPHFVCQVYSREQLDRWVGDNVATLVDLEYWEVFTGELWTFGERLERPRRSTASGRHQLACMLFRKGDR